MRYPHAQPLARSFTELQAQVDVFDQICNTQRPHQGLPGRMTPQQAWDATAKADPLRPRPAPTSAPAPPANTTNHTPKQPKPHRCPDPQCHRCPDTPHRAGERPCWWRSLMVSALSCSGHEPELVGC